MESHIEEAISWASSPAVRRSMIGNRSRDTSPELQVRRYLHSVGLRYRVDARPIKDWNRKADIVFSRAKLAVFIHGCFWHGCPEHYKQPKTNVEYWSGKIGRNVERDVETLERLSAEGWSAIVLWEHADLEREAKKLAIRVRKRLDRMK